MFNFLRPLIARVNFAALHRRAEQESKGLLFYTSYSSTVLIVVMLLTSSLTSNPMQCGFLNRKSVTDSSGKKSKVCMNIVILL